MNDQPPAVEYCRSCDHTHLVGTACWFAQPPAVGTPIDPPQVRIILDGEHVTVPSHIVVWELFWKFSPHMGTNRQPFSPSSAGRMLWRGSESFSDGDIIALRDGDELLFAPKGTYVSRRS